jgi:hypothetical protein
MYEEIEDCNDQALSEPPFVPANGLELKIEQEGQSLRDILRDFDLGDIVRELGIGDVLDVISAHDIMDYVCYLVMQRTDMREPGSKRMIFKREVLELAERINSEW